MVEYCGKYQDSQASAYNYVSTYSNRVTIGLCILQAHMKETRREHANYPNISVASAFPAQPSPLLAPPHQSPNFNPPRKIHLLSPPDKNTITPTPYQYPDVTTASQTALAAHKPTLSRNFSGDRLDRTIISPVTSANHKVCVFGGRMGLLACGARCVSDSA